MKIYKLLSFTILLGWVLLSCGSTDTDTNFDLNASKWEVVKIKNQGESEYQLAEKSYVLNFVTDTTFTLSLDINTCFGSYRTENNEDLHISDIGCSEACCDTDYAQRIVILLQDMKQYHINESELILKGKGEVFLKEI